MLARLLSGCVPVAHDSAGAIFIDRDGDLFRHVLAFLRDGPRAALPADADTLRALAVDADYYQLDGLKEAVNERLPEEGSLSPATARARARRAGPDGVLDAALAADGGRMLAALELLARLAFAPGADSFGGGGGAPQEVHCDLSGHGVCHQRRPGCFDAFVEQGSAAGAAGSAAFHRELEPAFDAPLLFGGGYDRAVYGAAAPRAGKKGGTGARSPPRGARSPTRGSPDRAGGGVWPDSLEARNRVVFAALAATPLPDPGDAALKDAILAVSERPDLAAALLVRRLGFRDGTTVRGRLAPGHVTWRPSCTYGTSDVFHVVVASVTLSLKF